MTIEEIKNQRIRAGMFAIAPAALRYDPNLTYSAKFLYLEVTACLDAAGYCTESDGYFAKLMGITSKTVNKYLAQLEKRHYIERVTVNNRRIIKLPTTQVSYFSPPGQKVDVGLNKDQKKFMDSYLDFFKKEMKTTLTRKEHYYSYILRLLETYSEEELWDALKNRIDFVNANYDWFKESNNIRSANNILAVIRDDESLFKWLNIKRKDDDKVTKDEKKVIPFKQQQNKDLLK